MISNSGFSCLGLAPAIPFSMAIKLAQLVVGATPDGGIGPKTVEKLNQVADGQRFKEAYALAKIARYAEICNKNREQSKFLLGWINRTLRGLT